MGEPKMFQNCRRCYNVVVDDVPVVFCDSCENLMERLQDEDRLCAVEGCMGDTDLCGHEQPEGDEDMIEERLTHQDERWSRIDLAGH